jgi:Zn-dependent protease
MEPNFEVLPPGRAQRPPGPPSSRPKPQGIVAWLIAGGVMAAKFGFLLLKTLKTSLSMVLMIWFYSLAFGWPFAIGFVVLIFVHEMGHVIAAKMLGMPVSAPIFIPFVGAYITMKQNPRDAWTEALMAYGGPLAGGAGGWLCWVLAVQMQAPWLMAVASATFVINLFNLIPVPPLDGGRICAAVSPWFWFIGLLLLGAAVLYFHAVSSIIIIIIVLIVAFPRLKQTLFQPPTEEMRRYYDTSLGKRLAMAAMYVGLIALLLLGYWDASQQLGPIGSGDQTPATAAVNL